MLLQRVWVGGGGARGEEGYCRWRGEYRADVRREGAIGGFALYYLVMDLNPWTWHRV